MKDGLTGLPNIIGLLEWVNTLSNQTVPIPFSLAAIQLTALWQVNREDGRRAGDDFLMNAARLMQNLFPERVFRAGGDRFVIYLPNANFTENFLTIKDLACQIQTSLLHKTIPPARAALIHFSDEKDFTPGTALACLLVSLTDHFHEGQNGQPVEFPASEIRSSMSDYSWMLADLADQIMRIGSTVKQISWESQIDRVSNLPNQRAAEQEMAAGLAEAKKEAQEYAILLIDGDNLRRFNSISYTAGDEAIQLMGAAIQQQLRENDFLARYRIGDEFLVLLRNTSRAQALQVAQRLCLAVEQASHDWLFHTTISIGVAIFPQDSGEMQELLQKAEIALAKAKDQGKNRVVTWPDKQHLAEPADN